MRRTQRYEIVFDFKNCRDFQKGLNARRPESDNRSVHIAKRYVRIGRRWGNNAGDPFSKSPAFTMIELMVVTLFLSIIGVYTWSYLRTTFNTQRTIEEKTDIQQMGTAIISRLTDDISQVFLVESYQKLTFFTGEPEKISFSALSHDPPNPEDRESDEAKISYTLEDDSASQNGTKTLLRKEVPYFTSAEEKDEGYIAIPVAHGIENLQFTYSDDGEKFNQEWDTLSTDHFNKLPKMVKIVMTIKDANDREEYFENLIALPMTDDINIQIAATATAPGTPAAGTGSTGTSSGTSTTTTNKPVAPGKPPTGGTSANP